MRTYTTPMAELLHVEAADIITSSPFMGLFTNSDGDSVGSGESISFEYWIK